MNLVSLKAKKIISLFASIICTIPIYLILHEGGHALIAILCGARITEFSILGAYMLYEGGIFPSITLSLFHAAGMIAACFCSNHLYVNVSRQDSVYLL